MSISYIGNSLMDFVGKCAINKSDEGSVIFVDI